MLKVSLQEFLGELHQECLENPKRSLLKKYREEFIYEYLENSLEESIEVFLEKSMGKSLKKYQEEIFRITQNQLKMMYLEKLRNSWGSMMLFHSNSKNRTWNR